MLKKAGWNVISNRYYVDDTGDETVRELDLVAYKTTKLPEFRIYTVLLLSCKKSETDAWALLSRPINVDDPNANWWPLHAWSNNKPLNFELSLPDTARRYHDAVRAAGVSDALALPAVEVFAYQEMGLHDGAPHNQKAIFQAVTSLIKAQSYEFQSLPQRSKDAVLYQLNLLSVVDAELIRLHFEKEDIVATPITDEHYITQYIVSKRHTVARVRFIKADHLGACLPEYAKLHDANCKWAAQRHETFYKEAVKYPRSAVFIDEFRSRVGYYLRARHKPRGKFDTFEDGDIGLDWQPSKNALAVTVGMLYDEDIEAWNNDEKVKAHVAGVLDELYRFKGPFFFSSDIPF
jgi:hypothetical protein